MKCSIENCENKSKYVGLCEMHYKRRWRHGDPNKTIIQHKLEPMQCSVELCDRQRVHSNGLCELHEQRQRRYGRIHTIVAAPGEGTINRAGYRVLTVEGQRVYEHIALAEEALGKPLPKGAIVHHMNNKPWDNFTPFNLVICPNQDYHLLLHRRAKELDYEDN